MHDDVQIEAREMEVGDVVVMPVAIEFLDVLSCHDSNKELAKTETLLTMFYIHGSSEPCDSVQTDEVWKIEMADIVLANNFKNDEVFCECNDTNKEVRSP